MEHVSRFLDFLDKRAVFHRAVLIWVLWLVGWVTVESWNFAWHSTRPGTEVALIIGAIQAPVTILLGAVTKFYGEYRS